MEPIIQRIANSCNIGFEAAKLELDAQIKYLRELMDANDFRQNDIYQACDDLGLEYDYAELIATMI